MKRIITVLGAALVLFGTTATAFCQKKTAAVDPVDQRVEALLAKMTTEEKIGQMTLFTSDWDVTGPTIRAGYADDIKSGKCGAIFNAHTAAYTRKLQEIAVKQTRLHIPLLFGYDVIHGYKTIFPIPLGESASWDLPLMERSAHVAGEEAAAAGLHWTFAPMVDISRDPRWGRCMEGAGEDTYLGSAIAKARVRGFQREIGEQQGVLACIKHFAAYGAAQAGRDYNTVDMSEIMLREVYLPPYKAGIDAGAATIMTSFNELNGVPASANHFLLTDILRKEWGFKGFVVTDYTSIAEMVQHGNVANEKEAGEASLKSGVDMDMQSAIFYKYTAQSLAEGKVTMAQINQATRRILRQKFLLGLFEDPYRFSDVNREKAVLLNDEHLGFARDAARKSCVLLKNEGQVLPLSKAKTVALIGAMANSQADMMGAWSGAGEAKDCVTLLTGLTAKAAKVIYAKGCNVEGDDRSGFTEAVNAANQADVVVVVAGETRDMTGEASSKTNIGIPGVQTELIQELMKTGKPVVVVLMNGRPITFPWIAEHANAILEAWWGGSQAGNGIAEVLYGDYNPAGKLPMTFPRNVGQVPIFYNAKRTGRPSDIDPNNHYASKYLDSPETPQYSFGFGLSYTTFQYSDMSVDKTTFAMKEPLQASIKVTNTGNFDGEEVVQFYVRDLVGSLTRPVKELKGFKKIMLKRGESQTVTFKLTSDDLRFYHTDMKHYAEPGDFDIMIGGNSTDVKKVRVALTPARTIKP